MAHLDPSSTRDMLGRGLRIDAHDLDVLERHGVPPRGAFRAVEGATAEQLATSERREHEWDVARLLVALLESLEAHGTSDRLRVDEARRALRHVVTVVRRDDELAMTPSDVATLREAVREGLSN